MIALLTIFFFSSFLSFLVLGFVNYFNDIINQVLVTKNLHLHWVYTPERAKLWEKIKASSEHQYSTKASLIYSDKEGLLYFHGQKTPLFIKLIDQDYLKNTPITISSGKLDEDIPSLIISESLMAQLNLHIGDIVTFFVKVNTLAAHNESIESLKLKITGSISVDSRENYFALAPLKIFRSLLPLKLYQGLILNNVNDLPSITRFLSLKLHTPVQNYKTLNSNLLYSLKWQKIFFLFVLSMVIIISFFIIYLGFFVIFNENKETLIILRILGVSNFQIQQVNFLQSLWLAFLGTFMSYWGILFFYRFIIPGFFLWINTLLQTSFFSQTMQKFFLYQNIFTFNDVALINLLEFLAICVGVLIPSMKIQNVPLYEVLKNE
jgi:ABC-type lipoprotein release transport system permease subunit